MIGSVYAVLFSNGLIKVGFSQNPAARIRKHISSGRSFGYTLDIFFFTEQHKNADKTEKALLKLCSEKFSKNSPEYFSGADYASAKEVMLFSQQLVCWGTSLSVKGDFLTIPVTIEKIQSKDKGEATKSKIINLIECSPGITQGLLKNKFRKFPVEECLDELEFEGKVSVEQSIHKNNKTTIRKFYPLK